VRTKVTRDSNPLPDDLPAMPDREAVLPSDHSQPRPNSRIVAHANELSVLKLVGQYEHLGRTEIARGVWHTASTHVAQKMCRRTVARLPAQRHLKEVGNSFGKLSLILTARGADLLRQGTSTRRAVQNSPSLVRDSAISGSALDISLNAASKAMALMVNTPCVAQGGHLLVELNWLKALASHRTDSFSCETQNAAPTRRSILQIG